MSGREERRAGTAPSAAELRRAHAGRARSAYDRAAATCRHCGIEPEAAQPVPTSPVGRAAGALRLASGSLEALARSAPDPAADARCARNAAAAAALAAQVAAARGDTGASPALRAALTASQAAAAAAGGTARGRDAVLNTAADAAEESAVAAARAAGWTD
ncbi:hypothetical protein [Streptomyces collinus]|uniref:hypothetical protein n=1 Tax=Streptomyces collinus TaxID=42684 RepID=UPI00041822FD|nr:hypothetical protein [Streptomyces collinus]UJA09303.1 hypothetical protein HGI10_32500 [Streptomyces collinus]UJA15833.1 hypothetical protein HGI09_31620 [Streptomyces collinus]